MRYIFYSILAFIFALLAGYCAAVGVALLCTGSLFFAPYLVYTNWAAFIANDFLTEAYYEKRLRKLH